MRAEWLDVFNRLRFQSGDWEIKPAGFALVHSRVGRGEGPRAPRSGGDVIICLWIRPSVEQHLRTFFAAADAEILAVYLYGSIARGSSTATSDVDRRLVPELRRPSTRCR
jgi:hypothetical protein